MARTKQAPLANTVLNVTVFEDIPGKNIGIPKKTTINITNLLKEKGADFFQIHGISTWSGEEDEYGCTPVSSRFVIDEAQLDNLKNSLTEIIDAAIVNTNQGKAIKKLINDKFVEFSRRNWENF